MPTARGSAVHRPAPAAAGLLLAVVLTGCSSTVDGEAFHADLEVAKPTVPPAPPGSTDPSAPPVAGTCYTIAAGQQDTPLDPPDPVECGGDHNAETAVVGESGLGEDAPYPAEADVEPDSGSPVRDALDDLCHLGVVQEYLGGDEYDDPYAYFSAYLPDQEQWDAGARWIRCDVWYGYSEPEPAPGILGDALLGGDPDTYRACFAGTQAGYDPVPCSQPHEAEPIGTETAGLAEDAPYPDEPTRLSLVDGCRNAAEDFGGGEVPNGYAVDVWLDSPGEWAATPYARCVLVPAGGGRTSTSARP